MTLEEVTNEITKINDYLEKCLWMDFEFARIDGKKIFVSGRVDTSYNDFAIDIRFDAPTYFSCLAHWTTADDRPFIELIDGEEKKLLKENFKFEDNHYIFRINAEDFDPSPILIISETIKCDILIDDPF